MRVTIMGLGLFGGGEGAARYFAERGDDVVITDLRSEKDLAPSLERLRDFKNIRCVLGRHDEDDFRKTDLLVVNPAVPDGNRYVLLAKDAGVAVTNETTLFLERTRSPILAVTGSNGKTTTTRLLHALLEAAGLSPYLAGNIGISLLPEAEAMDPKRPCVLEISSFQLERLPHGRAFFAGGILTNLTANHLDRHGTFAAYRDAKARLFECVRQSAFVVVNGADPETRALLENPTLRSRAVSVTESMAPAGTPPLAFLPGPTNRMNFLQALFAATMFTDRLDDAAVVKVAETFRGIEHRLETYARRNGVLFVNDSKATTPEATHAAVGAFASPIHLIAGGYDKKLAKDALIEDFSRCRSVHLIGATAADLAQCARARGITTHVHAGLEDAVRAAAAMAEAEDVVLLSPAHPSYGLFTDYRARGVAFRNATRALGGTIEVFPPALPERPA